MKILKKMLKIFIFIIAIVSVGISGLLIYVKMSPKLEIKSANAFLFAP